MCVSVPTVLGPCDPEDLIDGIIFAATYLGCTHLLSERTPTKSARMQQAQEAMNRVRVRASDGLYSFRFTSQRKRRGRRDDLRPWELVLSVCYWGFLCHDMNTIQIYLSWNEMVGGKSSAPWSALDFGHSKHCQINSLIYNKYTLLFFIGTIPSLIIIITIDLIYVTPFKLLSLAWTKKNCFFNLKAKYWFNISYFGWEFFYNFIFLKI